MKRWLKCDFHIHTSLDHHDLKNNTSVKYSPKQIIDLASKKGFDVLCLSHHDKLFFSKELVLYAKTQGILLIPGIEKTIGKYHILILNVKDDLDYVKKIGDLRKLPENAFVVAPHPYYKIASGINNKLEKYLHLFDAIEYAGSYFAFYNSPNIKAQKIAKQYRKLMVGNSDAHNFWQFGRTYTKVYAEKTIKGVLYGLNNGLVKLRTKPLKTLPLMQFIIRSVFFKILRKIKRIFK